MSVSRFEVSTLAPRPSEARLAQRVDGERATPGDTIRANLRVQQQAAAIVENPHAVARPDAAREPRRKRCR